MPRARLVIGRSLSILTTLTTRTTPHRLIQSARAAARIVTPVIAGTLFQRSCAYAPPFTGALPYLVNACCCLLIAPFPRLTVLRRACMCTPRGLRAVACTCELRVPASCVLCRTYRRRRAACPGEGTTVRTPYQRLYAYQPRAHHTYHVHHGTICTVAPQAAAAQGRAPSGGGPVRRHGQGRGRG